MVLFHGGQKRNAAEGSGALNLAVITIPFHLAQPKQKIALCYCGGGGRKIGARPEIRRRAERRWPRPPRPSLPFSFAFCAHGAPRRGGPPSFVLVAFSKLKRHVRSPERFLPLRSAVIGLTRSRYAICTDALATEWAMGRSMECATSCEEPGTCYDGGVE